ncbi:hypothetical protein, partial [Oryzisolibacter propanilivorax]|uniref:hypothetical protein n=1 Tax=Oryzisolibacter propanilivorax TaxID=1527607 RepID=UPI001C31E175
MAAFLAKLAVISEALNYNTGFEDLANFGVFRSRLPTACQHLLAPALRQKRSLELYNRNLQKIKTEKKS